MPTDRPNVLLVCTDQQRPDWFGWTDVPVQTPNTERLADRGVRFDTIVHAAAGAAGEVRTLHFDGDFGDVTAFFGDRTRDEISVVVDSFADGDGRGRCSGQK